MNARYGDPQRKADTVERDAEIIRLKRDEALTFQQIANQLGLSVGAVHKGFHRGLARVIEPEVTAYRQQQLARIEMMRESILEVFHARHITVSQGRVVKLEVPRPDGSIAFVTIPDSGPVLAAADRLMKLDDQEAKLLGLYPATKVDAHVEVVNYTVAGVDTDALK